MLELRDLYFSVGDRNIIDGINFTFEKGKFYGITGPNGSGKTTLAKLIMGINSPNGGEIRFGGKDISQWSITDRAREGIAYSFQQPARFKGITFRDLLAMAAGTDDQEMLLALLRRVGICSLSFLDKPVDAKLSGGEIKKIELATTIARNPRLAIYDEPDTGIDLWTIQPMVRLLKREQRDHDTTTIVVSHNRAFLEAADIVLMINEGKLAYRGDLQGALPMLNDLSICNYRKCVGDRDVGCYR
ncbi:MAG: ABC transporter ATP-binding protein [Pseudomonadota bacterium]|nr:ABC transporter ATP-binding protein [Pseudomonadota bacterium]